MRGQIVPPRPLAAPDLGAIEADITELKYGKANAGTLGLLTARVGNVESALDTKASASSVAAMAAAVPAPSSDKPRSESVGGAAGAEGKKFSMADHEHPRLSSTTGNREGATTHTIGSNGLATITFTRTFTSPPGTIFTEVPPLVPGAMSEFPADFRVNAWVMTDGKYTGCVVRCWRGQGLPLLTGVVTLLGQLVAALSGFNPFGASSAGTSFTCVAVARSDT